MYLRFVTTRIDEDSHKPQGVFVASYALLDSGDLTRDEWKRVRDILDWFNDNLPHPPKNFTTLQQGVLPRNCPDPCSCGTGALAGGLQR
jgi:hypothetical protein